MDWPMLKEIMTIYGPLALGWPIAIYLGKRALDRSDADVESRIKLALALEGLTDWIKQNGKTSH